MGKELYYEDFEAGQQFTSDRAYVIDRESSIAFSKEYDPQAQHIDEAGAAESAFGQLVVSGWQTAAATMRLNTETELFNVKGGLIGIGIESLQWPRPTLPGDQLRIVATILGKRPSNSRPDKGLIKYRVETFNQRNELAMSMVITVIVPRRHPAQ